jgi:hypothetical protein
LNTNAFTTAMARWTALQKRMAIGLGLAAVLLISGALYLWSEPAAKPYEGYTLFAPLNSTTTYLINNDGAVVHQWPSRHLPGIAVYLLDDGHLLRTAKSAPSGRRHFAAGGAGGKVEELDWDGKVRWGYTYSNERYRQHHDIERLPNGNILMIAWERKSAAAAVAAGRDPELLKDNELWPDHVIEVKPTPSGGEIVWKWHLWDHLVQDFDPTKENYGDVGVHPELVDINFVGTMTDAAGIADWTHINAIDYHPELDQILLSVHGFNEIWVIDHSTTTAEAAGHQGGRYGKGGDILYRWGNPRTYRAGGPEDQKLFGQHDAKWIAKGLPGQDHILLFNNGLNRSGKGKGYSTVVEIKPPLDAQGNYVFGKRQRYGPERSFWKYRAGSSGSFYSAYISGAQRLPNGNTLICNGYNGRFFEVTRRGKTVWSYTNPFGQTSGDDSVIKKNGVFRAERYTLDHPDIRDKELPDSTT